MELNGVHAHGVKKTVGEVSDAVHENHGPEQGVGHGVQLATGRHNPEQSGDHMQHQANG